MSEPDELYYVRRLTNVALRRYEPNNTLWPFMTVIYGSVEIPHSFLVQQIDRIPYLHNCPPDKTVMVFQDIADVRILIVDPRHVHQSVADIEDAYNDDEVRLYRVEVQGELQSEQ